MKKQLTAWHRQMLADHQASRMAARAPSNAEKERLKKLDQKALQSLGYMGGED